MKCIECKWFAGTTNDVYGVCKRYPQVINKNQNDWCGEFNSKIEVQKLEIKFEEPTEYEWEQANRGILGVYDISKDEAKPKRGRKPKE